MLTSCGGQIKSVDTNPLPRYSQTCHGLGEDNWRIMQMVHHAIILLSTRLWEEREKLTANKCHRFYSSGTQNRFSCARSENETIIMNERAHVSLYFGVCVPNFLLHTFSHRRREAQIKIHLGARACIQSVWFWKATKLAAAASGWALNLNLVMIISEEKLRRRRKNAVKKTHRAPAQVCKSPGIRNFWPTRQSGLRALDASEWNIFLSLGASTENWVFNGFLI